MDYTVKTEAGRTIVSVLTDKPLTHCVIDVPGVSEAGKKPEGCAIIPDPDGRIKDAFTFTPEQVNALGDPFAPKPGGVMYANDPEGISHANHCECSRCESVRTPVDAAPHVVQG